MSSDDHIDIILFFRGYPLLKAGWIRYHPSAGRHSKGKQTSLSLPLDLHVLSL